MSWLHWFDNAPLVGFYALGLVAIIASLRVIMLANPVHAILSMIVSLLALAGIFFIVGAPFAGALQVIVYAGAILVLFVFVIMMLNIGIKNDERESRWLSGEVWAVPTGLTLIIAVVLYAMIAMGHGDSSNSSAAAHIAGVAGTSLPVASTSLPMMGTETVSAKQVGIALFSEYLMLVEVAAMLLLGALVAAYHLGKKALDDENVSHSSHSNEGAHKGGILESAHPVAAYEYDPVNAQDFLTQAPVTPAMHLSASKPNKPNKEGR